MDAHNYHRLWLYTRSHFQMKQRSLVYIFMCLWIFFGHRSPAMAKPQELGSLRGSARSLDRQQGAARRAGLTLFQTGADVQRAVKQGKIQRFRPSRQIELANVSFPYAHPKLSELLKKLGDLYYRECREPLVVTSLVRPRARQPKNASSRSVHPSGIAADLRVPSGGCRVWLRETLRMWEKLGVIEATRERRPPHFHLVVIPHKATGALVQSLEGYKAEARHSRASPLKRKDRERSSRKNQKYTVKSGDSLWNLAQRWKVTVQAIKRRNGLSSTRIDLGQILIIP